MNYTFTDKTSVGEIVAHHPETRRVFELFGIDYCCSGSTTLEDAVARRGVPLDALRSALDDAIRATPAQPVERNWLDASLSELVDFIEETHHMFLKQEMPRLYGLFIKVLQANGSQHGEILVPLEEIFELLKAEIELHVFKEEHILFPYIRKAELYAEGRGPKPEFHLPSLESPVRQMQYEHDDADVALRRMRQITSNYTLPKDASEDFRALYDGLQAVEDDIHQHVHLENNILFPRALELERSHAVSSKQ